MRIPKQNDCTDEACSGSAANASSVDWGSVLYVNSWARKSGLLADGAAAGNAKAIANGATRCELE